MCFEVPAELRATRDAYTKPRAEQARIFGQDEGTSGWLVRIESSGRLLNSRDVRTATGIPLDFPLQGPLQGVVPPPPPVKESRPPPALRTPPAAPPQPPTSPIQQQQQAANHPPEPPAQPPPPADVPDSLEMDAPAEPPATQLCRSSRRYARDGNLAAEAAFISATSVASDEPTTLAKALSRPDADEWRKAANAELENLNAKGT